MSKNEATKARTLTEVELQVLRWADEEPLTGETFGEQRERAAADALVLLGYLERADDMFEASKGPVWTITDAGSEAARAKT